MLDTVVTSSRFRNRQLVVAISYSRSQSGPIKRLVATAKNRGGEDDSVYGDSAASYEVLPWRTYMEVTVDGVQYFTNHVGMELLRQGRKEEAFHQYRPGDPASAMVNQEPDGGMRRLWLHDTEEFWRRYGCKPPAAVDAFIQMAAKIDEAIEMGAAAVLQPLASVTPTIIRKVNERTGKAVEWVGMILSDWRPRPGVTYFIGGDPGESGDSFGLAVYHIIPPGEQGCICPKCWKENIYKRMTKHYVPEPLPTREEEPEWRPAEWACDWCQAQPRYQQPESPTLFWGIARPSGQPWLEDVVLGYDQSGEPIYETEAVLVVDEVTGEHRREDRRVTRQIYLPVVVEDLLIEWEPDRVNSRPVGFENVRDTIWEIVKRCRVGAAAFDKWQSTMMVQSLVKGDAEKAIPGIDAEALFPSNTAQLAWYGNGKTLLMQSQTLLQSEAGTITRRMRSGASSGRRSSLSMGARSTIPRRAGRAAGAGKTFAMLASWRSGWRYVIRPRRRLWTPGSLQASSSWSARERRKCRN